MKKKTGNKVYKHFASGLFTASQRCVNAGVWQANPGMQKHTHYLHAGHFVNLGVVVGLGSRVPQELEHGRQRLLHQKAIASNQHMWAAFGLLEAAHLRSKKN